LFIKKGAKSQELAGKPVVCCSTANTNQSCLKSSFRLKNAEISLSLKAIIGKHAALAVYSCILIDKVTHLFVHKIATRELFQQTGLLQN